MITRLIACQAKSASSQPRSRARMLTCVARQSHEVMSENRRTGTLTSRTKAPKCCSLFYGDPPKKVTLILGNPKPCMKKYIDIYIYTPLYNPYITPILPLMIPLNLGSPDIQSQGKNWRICSFYAVGLAFTLALTWAKPGDFSCASGGLLTPKVQVPNN